MRYIVETKRDNLSALDFEAGIKGLKIVDQYEPLEKIARSVEKVGLALREYKANGITDNVLLYYLKGRGHTEREIKAIMGDVKDFFKKVGLSIE